MANPEHLAKLEEGVEAWNRWMVKNLKVKPDLRQACLRGASLPGINLHRADFQDADLRGADLQEADLSEVNLQGADLRGTFLMSANLRVANLQDADLQGAYLRAANLQGAYIRGANLQGVDIQLADLQRSDLQLADLQEADIRGANLWGANLKDTDLQNASMGFTVLADTDVGVAKGIDSIEHYGPSTIGIGALYKSKGKIPEVFLRGCGIPEGIISYIPYLEGKQIKYYSCFISYSHVDKLFAQRLHDTLQDKGVRCWLDEHQLLPGDDIHDEIDRGIRLWDKVILICSKESLTSWWVDKEIDMAFNKEEQLWKKHGKKVLALIPIDLDGFIFEGWDSGKAPIVQKRYIADLNGWEKDNKKFEEQFQRILKALRTEETGKEAPPKPKL